MNGEFFTFGEILWDCLPSGRHAGGAPFNVAVHLRQLGVNACLISSVGRDALGDELLEVAKDKRVDIRFVDRARVGLATGTVVVTLDEAKNATYELVQPAAWDEIRLLPKLLEAVANSKAFVFGSLAGRSPYNLDQLDRLLAVEGPLKYFDVNLRPPFADVGLVIRLAKRADVIKLNHDEVGLLAAYLKGSGAKILPSPSPEIIEESCTILAAATKTDRVCVTMASSGAALWDRGHFTCVSAPAITVRDTVGAGDAFMAGLVTGLTQGIDARVVLETACRLGAFVASHYGATPLLPSDMVKEITRAFKIDGEVMDITAS